MSPPKDRSCHRPLVCPSVARQCQACAGPAAMGVNRLKGGAEAGKEVVRGRIIVSGDVGAEP